MNAEEIRTLRLADPFQPFRLLLQDGRAFEIRKPFHLAMAQNNSRILIVTGDDTAVWFAPSAVREAELLASEQPTGARK